MAATPLYASSIVVEPAIVALTTTGLLGSDDFTRANEELGASPNWTEDVGDWEVVSNHVEEITDNDDSVARFTGTAERDEMCVQAKLNRKETAVFPNLAAKMSAVQNGYLLNIENAAAPGFGFYTLTGTTVSAKLASFGPLSALNTDYVIKFYVKDNVQKAWVDGSTATPLNTTNATWLHIGSGGFKSGIFGGVTNSGQFDDFFVMTNNTVTVTGLSGGQKIRLGGDATIVAAEVGGTATVDCGHLLFPITQIEVLSSIDVVELTVTGLTVYGGDDWAYTGAGPSSHIAEVDATKAYTDQASSADPPVAGATYSMEFLTQPFDIMEPGLEGWLTEITQNVEQINGATILVEIIANEGDIDAPTESKTVTLVTGDPVVTRFPFRARGSQVRLKIVISGFTSRVELGKMDLWKFARRMGKRRRDNREQVQ